MAEPKYRFKRNDGSSFPAWKEMPLGTLVSDNLDPVPTPREGYRRVGIYCHAKGTFQEDVPAENVLDVDTMYRIHKDNLIVNITFAWEHAVAIVKPEDEGLLVSHRFPEYSFNAGQVPGFYKYLVLRPYFRNQLSLASPGGAGRNRVLNKAQFKKIPVSVPCEEEQQKIADFLSSVDEVITASEEEVANLETQKKAVMKKIFSQEVRFKRADGSDFPEWEDSTIEETCDCLDNMRKPITKSDRESGPYPYYGSTNIQDYVAGYLFDEPLVLLAEDAGPFMEFWEKPIAQWAEGKFWVNNHAHVLRPQGNRKFMFYQLEHKDIREFINNPGRGKLNQEDMRKIVVGIPCLEEQRLIADFLSDFDEAIAAAKKELELWKKLKKGLLQQMFV